MALLEALSLVSSASRKRLVVLPRNFSIKGKNNRISISIFNKLINLLPDNYFKKVNLR